MLQNNLSLLSILSLIVVCTQAYNDPYHHDNHPVLAKIMKENGNACTGAYYKDGFIITSGACAKGIGKNDKVILKDGSLQQDPLPSYAVIKSFTHPKFMIKDMKVMANYDGSLISVNRGKSYDLGLVQIDILQKPPNDRKLTIAGLNEHDKFKTPLEGIVWGIDDIFTNHPMLANHTDYAQFDVMSNDRCDDLKKSLDNHLAFCADSKHGGGLSHYNYGSPVIFHDDKSSFLVGVFSKNQPDKGYSSPFVVTKAAPLRSWINEVILSNKSSSSYKITSKNNRHPEEIFNDGTGIRHRNDRIFLETNKIYKGSK